MKLRGVGLNPFVLVPPERSTLPLTSYTPLVSTVTTVTSTRSNTTSTFAPEATTFWGFSAPEALTAIESPSLTTSAVVATSKVSLPSTSRPVRSTVAPSPIVLMTEVGSKPFVLAEPVNLILPATISSPVSLMALNVATVCFRTTLTFAPEATVFGYRSSPVFTTTSESPVNIWMPESLTVAPDGESLPSTPIVVPLAKVIL